MFQILIAAANKNFAKDFKRRTVIYLLLLKQCPIASHFELALSSPRVL